MYIYIYIYIYTHEMELLPPPVCTLGGHQLHARLQPRPAGWRGPSGGRLASHLIHLISVFKDFSC